MTTTSGNLAQAGGTIAATGTVSLDAPGNLGSASARLEFDATYSPTVVTIGNVIQPAAVYLDGQGSLTLAKVTGSTTNTVLDVTARNALTVAAGASILTGSGTVSLADDVNLDGSRNLNSGLLAILSSAQVNPANTISSAILLRATTMSIDASANPAQVGAYTIVLPRARITGVAPSGTQALSINFTEAVVGANQPANYQVQAAGADGLLGTADDVVVTPTGVVYTSTTATLTVPALADGLYRVTVLDNITDVVGHKLDGNADSVPGGNQALDFVVTSSPLVSLPSPNGISFSVQAGGLGAGQLVRGTTVAVDAAPRLQVGGQDYTPTLPVYTPPAEQVKTLPAYSRPARPFRSRSRASPTPSARAAGRFASVRNSPWKLRPAA